MCYDYLVSGEGNPLHPNNIQENEKVLTYEEELEDEILVLKSEINRLKNIITFRSSYNKTIAKLCQGSTVNNTFIINKLNDIL